MIDKQFLFEQIHSYIKNNESIDLIDKAFEFAKDKHKDQIRKSGEPYFNHLLSVCYELVKLQAGPLTLCAGLLHDVIEDCDVDIDEFISMFGQEVFDIVQSVTKISTLKFQDEKEYQAENHRKIFIAMANDIRVIIVKLCDRLHNMRTLEFQSVEKQIKIAKETLEVYAPIAHRLGLAEIKNELEDLCFYFLDNETYHEIAKLVDTKKQERETQIKSMIERISKILDEYHIPYRIFGRSKHLYSIHKKMKTKHKRFDEILDLLAIRIVTETKLNCYEILGYIHAEYRPIPGRLKDYIAMPKVNLYQSLHTTIVGLDGKIFEIQIRTEEMDQIAEKGIAAHWSYKENKSAQSKQEQEEILKELHWLKVFKKESNADANEYMSGIKQDIFNANIYVMTPMGRVIDLPNGATPIDFAYRVHTEVGNTMVGARINDILVPLNTALKTGDVIEIITNKNSSPSKDWIKIAKTSNAQNRIKNYFTKLEYESKKEKIHEGKNMLLNFLKQKEVDIEKYMDEKRLEKVSNDFQIKNLHEFYYSIATKSLTCLSIYEKLIKPAKKGLGLDDILKQTLKNNLKRPVKSKYGIMVSNIDSIKIEFATCCTPVYGDDVIGFVSKANGLKIHRSICPNVLSQKRLINVQWDSDVKDLKYDANLTIFAKDRNYLLSDVITVISQHKANLTSVNVNTNKQDFTALAHISISISNNEELDLIMKNLCKVNSIISVERSFN